MSGQFVRLKDSERNALIENFRNGITDPNYEVIPSKTTTGKYTIRRRKVALPTEEPAQEPVQEEDRQEEQLEPIEEPLEDDDQNYVPPSWTMPYPDSNSMFQEMQMAMNKMFIEQMKMMRKQVKYNEKKREKMKLKSKRISDMLTTIVDQAQREEDEEQQAAFQEQPKEEEEIHEVQSKEIPKATPSFPATETLNKLTAPVKEYKNEYERNLDQMAGDVYKSVPSRRNRLNTDKFGI